MNKLMNLPGHYVYRDDGGLAVLSTIPGDVTLVIGTAPEGPFGTYFVTDVNDAVNAYGGDTTQGTLLNGMLQAYSGGAKNIALYRIGATPTLVDFINGYTIVIYGNPASYNLFHDAASNVFRITDDSGIVKYDSITGKTSPDVVVFGNQIEDTITIGTSSTPLSITSLKSNPNIGMSPSAITAGAGTDEVTVANGESFKAGMTVNDGTNDLTVIYSADNIVKLDGNTDNAATTLTPLITYVDAKDGLNLTLNELYQELERAYAELETANVDVVVPMGVFIDSPNLIDNEGNIDIPATDYLSKAYKFESNGQVFFVFDTKGTGTISDLQLPTPYEVGLDGYAAKAWLEGTHAFDTASEATSQSDIDAMSDDIHFSEINFAHQLATYCYNLSTNDNEAFGVIAFTPFTANARQVVSSWKGSLPVRDANGNTLKSGKGVLGNKLVSGSVGVNAGIYLTNNDMYGGVALVDPRTNLPLDIGYFIDVVSTPLRFFYTGVSNGEVVSPAAAYAGLVGGLEKNDPIMRKTLNPSLFQTVYSFTNSDYDKLLQAKTIPFKAVKYSSAIVPTVVDAPTCALSTSDYTSRFAARTVSGIIDAIRVTADPFIGKITGPSHISNLQDALISTLFTLQQPGESQYLIAGTAEVRQTAQQRIDGHAVVKLTLRIPGVLRRIETYILLQR